MTTPEERTMPRATLRCILVCACCFFLTVASVPAQTVPQQPIPPAKRAKPDLSVESPRPAAPFSPSCQAPRERGRELTAELETLLGPQVKAAAEQYVAKPGSGVSVEKAWGDFAAGAVLAGDAQLAVWAGLKATAQQWAGETVTNAGVYLFALGKTNDARQFLLCAYAMGHRSPYLFEALATVHQKLGDRTGAQQAIQQAKQIAPDDRLIETSASFLTTGQPPPPPSPTGDGIEDAMRELEQHAGRALTLMKMQAETLERSLPGGQDADYYAIAQTYIDSLVKAARDQLRMARTAEASARPMMITGVLMTFIYDYAQITDTLLSFPDSTSGSPLLFWADVLGLDAPSLARESHRNATHWSMHGIGPALAQGATDEFYRQKDAGYAEHNTRVHACRSDECTVRETARWCGDWKPLYERWADRSRQRHNKAARSFDRIATQALISAENELLLTRDYAVRQVKKMQFQKTPGFDTKGLMLKTVNESLRSVFEKHLSQKSEHSGTVPYLRERARWFEEERSSTEHELTVEQETIERDCQPVMAALLELLIQEEWQAYRDHLRDRLDWDIQGQAETNEFPCEGTIGPLTIGTDLNKPGEGKMDIKWSRKGVPVSASGSVTLRQDQTIGLGVGVSYKGEYSGDSDGPPVTGSGSGTVRDQVGKSGVGGGVGYGPFAGKGSVTFTTKVSPWNSREYLGFKLKGSAGLGLKRGNMGVACYPSSGSVTLYPRALYEDSVRYLSTPATPPR